MMEIEPGEMETLVREARQGQAEAFRRLAEAFRPRLLALVASRMGPRLERMVDREDVVQETLLRARRSLDRFESTGNGSFLRWLGGIAGHVLLEAAKSARRRPEPLEGDDLAAPGVSPSRALRREERFERLRAALEGLTPDHRRVILLARVERLPLKEVARRMERSPEAATQLLFRALRKLKETFGATDSFHLPPRSLMEESPKEERP